MKEYLNKEERSTLLFLYNLLDKVFLMITDWDKRGNLTKEERKALKTAYTWGIKAHDSILKRQSEATKKVLVKEMKSSAIHLDLRHSLEMICKKKSAKLDAAFNENKEYYRLVELIMDVNCKGCNKPCSQCDFFSEFQEQCVPYFDGDEKKGNCKYSF